MNRLSLLKMSINVFKKEPVIKAVIGKQVSDAVSVT